MKLLNTAFFRNKNRKTVFIPEKVFDNQHQKLLNKRIYRKLLNILKNQQNKETLMPQVFKLE